MPHLVKICGNKNLSSSLLVAAAKPDIMGWIFSPKSKRRLDPKDALLQIQMIRTRFPDIQHWGVFAKNSMDEIRSIIRTIPELSAIQVVEDADFCMTLTHSLPTKIGLVPALRVSKKLEKKDWEAYGNPAFFVMDAFVSGEYGGTGKRLDISLLHNLKRPWILAGGLSPENVADAIREAGPFLAGVDVSSGVETGNPGSKDEKKVLDFIRKARYAFQAYQVYKGRPPRLAGQDCPASLG